MDTARRGIGVSHVICRVVIGNRHVDAGSLGEGQRCFVLILPLPIEIPIIYIEKWKFFPVGNGIPEINVFVQSASHTAVAVLHFCGRNIFFSAQAHVSIDLFDVSRLEVIKLFISRFADCVKVADV